MNAKTVFSTALVWTVVGLGAVRGQTTPNPQGTPLSSGPQSAASSLPPAAGPLSPPSSLPPGGPSSGPNEVPGGPNGMYGVSSWIRGDKYGCCDHVGGNGPIQTELFFNAGVSIPLGHNGQVALALQNGLDLGVGGRTLFFDPAMVTAWDIVVGITNITNHAHGSPPMALNILVPQLNPVTNTVTGVPVSFGSSGVPGVTLQDLNRTFVDLGGGKEWYLWGAANSCGPKLLFGIDGGGRYGTERAEFHEIPHRTDVIAGMFAAVRCDYECPLCGCFVLQAGVRVEYSYTWSDIMQIQNNSDVQDLNILFSIGVRF
jgi:hypothetical protein